jgi:hypothetical protein
MAVDIDGVNSTISTDKLIPQSGTALQIGESSDVITIPSGATLVNSGTATGFSAGFTEETEQATTSGSSITGWTSIPSGVTVIICSFYAVSTTGAVNVTIQIGNGSFITSGYTGYSHSLVGNPINTDIDAGFGFLLGSASYFNTGIATLTKHTSGDVWIASGHVSDWGNTSKIFEGYLDLGGTLDRVRLTTSGTFDAGSFNIKYI